MIESIIAFFQNNAFATILSLLVVYAYKFFPKFKDFTNKANTFLAAFVAWFSMVFVGQAEASIFSKIISFDPIIPSILIGLADKVIHELLLSPLFKATGINVSASVDK